MYIVVCINPLKNHKQSIMILLRVMYLNIKDIRVQLKTFTRMEMLHHSTNMNLQSKLVQCWTQYKEEKEETIQIHRVKQVHLLIETIEQEKTII
jgi:hypothetical protein